MVNKVILIGRLGRDPEVRYTASGTPVANFSIATDERWTDNEGNRQTRTEWHNIVLWRGLATVAEQYLKKGKLIYVEGRIQTREWDDRDGNKRRTTEIVGNNMQMLDRGNGGDSGKQEKQEEPNSSSMEIGITDDDIPF
jgi:single-strand DNA-binding protein